MNFIGVAAVILSVVAFAAAHTQLRPRLISTRILYLCGFALLAVPSVWFAVYYLHILREHEWFYTLRSWPGSEFLVVFLGCAGGAAAALLPRLLLGLPLFAVLALGVVPYIKPLIGPLPDDVFHEQSQGDVSLQSTPSTCGPASVTTILRRLGVSATERATARAAFSYGGGTEAWYLARYVRSRGLSARFDFRRTFSPSADLPALVGVRLGGVGHFYRGARPARRSDYICRPTQRRGASFSRPVPTLTHCSATVTPQRGGAEAPHIGARMPVGSSSISVAHKGRTLCSHWIEAAGVRYSFDVKCGSGIVVYVQTHDTRFRTQEGVGINGSLASALGIKGSRFAVIDGSCGVSLPSGWIARVSLDVVSPARECEKLLSEPIAFFDTRYLRE